MPDPTVRIYDFETRTIVTIRASELAPSMVRGQVEGVEGEVYIDPTKVRLPGVFLHAPFPDAVRQQVDRIREVFHDVSPHTLEELESGFRRDTNPGREIALWLWMADVFEQFTAGRELVYEERKDIFDVILFFVTYGKDYVRHTMTKPLTLSDRRLNDMLDELVERYWQAPWERYVRDASDGGELATDGPAGGVPIHALFAADGVSPNPLPIPSGGSRARK
jgi:hypothetical protein